MLDLVPLRGPGREVADRDLQPRLLRELRELLLPGPVPGAVRRARVAGDQQPRRAGVGAPADEVPPRAQRRDRERPGVRVRPDVHEARVRRRVVDPVGDRVPGPVPVRERVVQDPRRPARGVPFPPGLRVVPDLLPLLRVHADDRLPGRHVLSRLLADVPELGVPVRVPAALQHLRRGLHRVPLRPQQPPRGLRADRVALRRQRVRQVPHAPGRPPQRRLRVSPGGVRDQVQQRRDQAGIGVGELPAPPARPPDPACRDGITRGQLGRAVRDRLPRRPGQPRDRAGPALAGSPRDSAQREPPPPLVQLREQQLQLRDHHRQQLRVHSAQSCHATRPQLRLFRNAYLMTRTPYPSTRR